MTPDSANIMNLLPGGIGVNPSSPSGGPVATEADGNAFGDLLSLMVAGEETGPQVELPGLESNETNRPFSELLLQTEAETAVPVDLVSALAVALDPGMTATVVAGPEMPVQTENPVSLLPQRSQCALLMNEELTTFVPDGLEPATYRVMASRIADGQVEITVAAEEKQTQPVKVTIPVESFSEVESSTESESRVRVVSEATTKATATVPKTLTPLNDQSLSETTRLEKLLSELNLKAIEVQRESSAQSEAVEKDPVKVRLVGEKGGQPLVLKAELSRQEISVKTISRSAASTRLATAETAADEPSATVEMEANAVKPTRFVHAVTPDATSSRQSITFDLAERLAAQKVDPLVEQNPSVDQSVSGKTSVLAEETRVNLPNVRFTLPDMIAKPSLPGNQSIMIKIEPEQLGPARLHLTMRNDALTARVVVDNSLAKVAVEHSLDQLSNQLARAGVQVDRIEVALSGENAGQQQFDRQSEWSGSRRIRQPRFDLEQELGQVAPSPVISPSTQEYLRADGVNLLA